MIKVRIEATIGDKIIANEREWTKQEMRSQYFPVFALTHIFQKLWEDMHPAVRKALLEFVE